MALSAPLIQAIQLGSDTKAEMSMKKVVDQLKDDYEQTLESSMKKFLKELSYGYEQKKWDDMQLAIEKNTNDEKMEQIGNVDEAYSFCINLMERYKVLTLFSIVEISPKTAKISPKTAKNAAKLIDTKLDKKLEKLCDKTTTQLTNETSLKIKEKMKAMVEDLKVIKRDDPKEMEPIINKFIKKKDYLKFE